MQSAADMNPIGAAPNPSVPPQAKAPQADTPPAMGSTDALQRRRLRWRLRRGMLENDLILTRFLDQHEANLTDQEVLALEVLMDLSDNELLDLFLFRAELTEKYDNPAVRSMLNRIRAA